MYGIRSSIKNRSVGETGIIYLKNIEEGEKNDT
jgi:hypothetical protein